LENREFARLFSAPSILARLVHAEHSTPDCLAEKSRE
jgi:hypothetical protein